MQHHLRLAGEFAVRKIELLAKEIISSDEKHLAAGFEVTGAQRVRAKQHGSHKLSAAESAEVDSTWQIFTRQFAQRDAEHKVLTVRKKTREIFRACRDLVGLS